MNRSINLFSLTIAMAVVMFSCGPQGEKAATGDALSEGNMTGEAYNADLTSSVIAWEGTKPDGTHNGTIRLQSGSLMVDGDVVTGGEFVIDMKSIVCLDLTDAEYNAKLVGHLMSPDFFAVDSFPTARFKTTLVEKLANQVQGADGILHTHSITGNLTMKDVTKSITFKAAISVANGKVTAVTGPFVIDRSSWNIKYGSRKFFDNLKDKFIYDEIGLNINLTATK